MFLSLNEKFKKYFLAILFLGIIIFILFHLKNFLFREEIIFSNLPESNKILTNSDEFILKGRAKHIKKITINKKEYFLDQNENFSIRLNLFVDENIFIFEAVTESGEEVKRKFFVFRKE